MHQIPLSVYLIFAVLVTVVNTSLLSSVAMTDVVALLFAGAYGNVRAPAIDAPAAGDVDVDHPPVSPHLRRHLRGLQWTGLSSWVFNTTQTSITLTWGCDKRRNTFCLMKADATVSGKKTCLRKYRIYRNVIDGDGEGGTCTETVDNLECNTAYTVFVDRAWPAFIGIDDFDVSKICCVFPQKN